MTPSPDPRVRVAVLGPVLVEDRAGALREPSGALGKSLIVALALARGATLSVQSLVNDLWNDAPPRQERAALQTLVSRLRTSTAEGILESTPSGYALAIEPTETDLGLAAVLLDRVKATRHAGDHREAESLATTALGLWRGEPAVELGETPLASELLRRAGSLSDQLHRLRGESRIELGDLDGAASDIDPLSAAAPLDESLQLLRMRTLAAAGRRNDAIRLFGEFRARLRDELGTHPGSEMLRLNTSLLRDDAAAGVRASDADARDSGSVTDDSATRAASLPTLRSRRGLRTAPNKLIGRERELEAIGKQIAGSRLTTLLGPGGIGKTRLAQELGHRSSQLTSVIFVELASVRSSEDVPLAFASTLGIHEARTSRITVGDPEPRVALRSRIIAALSETDTLLIVDNCEHLVDAAAEWVADILDSTANVRVLATSRAPLAIGAEQVFLVESLSSAAPPSGDHAAAQPTGANTAQVSESDLGPAVALFAERARAARPTVILPLDVVARLCDRLDGLPLAIELAAARTRSMSVEEIERRLNNRFALLTGGERTAPERHRTLLAVIDWSWNLLHGGERALLRRLSRFPDGFSAEAAQFVAGGDGALDVTDDLDALINQSLVSVSEDAATGILRYRMLETVREFGDLALVEAGESDLVRNGMYEWATYFARRELRRMNGPTQLNSFQLITAEQDNLVATLRMALGEPRPDIVVTVFAGLGYYWSLRGAHTEVLAFGALVVDATKGYQAQGDQIQDAAGAFAIIGATFMYTDLRTSARAISMLRKLKRLAPLTDSRLNAMTDLLLLVGNMDSAMSRLAQLQESPDQAVACVSNLMASQFQENAGDIDAALVTARRAYELSLELDDAWSRASSAQSIAQLNSQLAHPREALLWAERAATGLNALQATGDLRQLDWMVAINAVTVGQLERARPVLERFANDSAEELGFDFMDLRAIGRSGLAEIALVEGRTDEGLNLYRDAVAGFGPRFTAPVPWRNIVAGACLVAHVRADVPDRSFVDGLAHSLRTGLLVAMRLQPGFVDKPVLGSALVGIAAWLLWPRDTAEGANTHKRELGLELFALAERLNGRQDLPTLNRERFARELRSRDDDGLQSARESASRLSRDESAARAVEALRAWRPRPSQLSGRTIRLSEQTMQAPVGR
jgi:predicted ATPase/DNA-binding SARP family transcriptional activator/tetratricopeptide (TPR) repeat protein